MISWPSKVIYVKSLGFVHKDCSYCYIRLQFHLFI